MVGVEVGPDYHDGEEGGGEELEADEPAVPFFGGGGVAGIGYAGGWFVRVRRSVEGVLLCGKFRGVI